MQTPFVHTAPSIARLTVLADFLNTLPTVAFNMQSWVRPPDDEQRMESLIETSEDGRSGVIRAGVAPEEMHACGTAACAAGWAGTIPELKAQGLVTKRGSGQHGWQGFTPTFSDRSGFDACSAFFEVSQPIAEQFFYPHSFPYRERQEINGHAVITPQMVAERIYAYLEDPEHFARIQLNNRAELVGA